MLKMGKWTKETACYGCISVARPENNSEPMLTHKLSYTAIAAEENTETTLFNVCLQYSHIIYRPVLSVRLDQSHLSGDSHTLLDTSEDGMFPVEVGCRCKCNEELRSICVGPGISHAQYPCACMFQRWMDLIGEFLSICQYNGIVQTYP
jgi:hypothetical protein